MTTFTETRIVLQYDKAGDVQTQGGGYIRYVHENEAEKFVALDDRSGGYPYSTSVLNAHDFKTVEKAKSYATSEGFHVRKLTLTCEVSEPSQSD